ncbi:MAG: DUF3472 domain-containing protein [Gemmatimonadetes bacterium]|nr:DUF3472 domain-containing protein [Gemmatimonadota bacterium]
MANPLVLPPARVAKRVLGVAFVAAALASVFAAAPTAGTIRVPAATAYIAPDPGSVRFPRNGEVAPFARAGTSLQWFGAFTSAGTVTASLELQAPAGQEVTLRLEATDEPADGAWPRAAGTAREITVRGTGAAARVSVGALPVGAPGYVRFALSVRQPATTRDLKVLALLLEGAPADSAQFNLVPRRNAASVHLRYPVDSAEVITGFYNEIIAVDDPVTTYYMATGFARGYFGMQVNSPTERRIIFSVWDAGNGTNADDRSTVAADDQTQLLGKGDGVVAEVFGNEGTGGHSHLVYDWQTGSTQRFFVTARLHGTHTIYSGYWFHPERQRWMLIASFRAPKDGQGLRRLYSFSENFGGETGHLRRKARFGPAWIRLASGEWRELTTATFSHDVTGRADRFDRTMGVEDGRFFLRHGGFVSGATPPGAAFTRPATGAPPAIDLPR